MSASAKPAELIRVAVVADTTGAAGEIARSLRDSGYAVRAFSLSAGGALPAELSPRCQPDNLTVNPASRQPESPAVVRLAEEGPR